jgi:hypothetical protein
MKVVSDFMGNFIFETLPHDIYYDERKRKKEKQKPEVRVMLRMLKRLHFNLDYKPSQVHNINHWVRQCGGTILTQDDLRKQKREKFLKQRQDLESGAEMPRSEKRKLKKKIRMVEKIAVTRKAKAENRKKQYELHKARAMVQSQIEADSGKKKLGLFGLFGRVFSDSK